MPRYHFNFHNGTQSVIDHLGRDFANDAAARQEAVLTARDAVTGVRLGLRHYGGWKLVVTNQDGAEIYAVVIPKST